MTIITSKGNSIIKKAKKLQQKKYRTQSYLIEGWHLLEEALDAGAVVEQVFVVAEEADRLADLAGKVVLVSPEVLKELADSPSPQGVVAQLALPASPPNQLQAGRYLVLEDVQDPGNVGTMIRTADAAGFDGVLVTDKTADLYNPKTLRSMQGSHFHLPIYRLGRAELIQLVKRSGLQLLATTLSDQSVGYRDLPPLTDFALVMGNEGAGISGEMAEQADVLVHIPMPGQAESLNVAVAAGILMFSLV